MKWLDYLAIGVLGLIVFLLVGYFQVTPGYMDAEYYFSGGQRLASGYGFSDLFLWNYLDDPQGVPHPSHTYWMPLASILVSFGMKTVGSQSFFAGRVGFLLLAGFVPPVTAALAYRLTSHRWAAWLGGLLAVFPAFYLPYLPTTDTFALYMLLGTLWLWLAAGYPLGFGSWQMRGHAFRYGSAIILGVICGLMHLTRADGLQWLLLALVSIFVWREANSAEDSKRIDVPGIYQVWKSLVFRLALCILGYLLVMGPWMARNLALFGGPFASGGFKALWFIDYDDLFIFPASILTPARWLANGLDEIIQARLWAFGQNIQSMLAVQGMIVLAPLVVWGFWIKRKMRIVQVSVVAWVSLLLLMTIPFPFAGARGGFFHSAAALQPLFWAVVPCGLEGFVCWGIRVRGWRAVQARRVFTFSILVLAMMLSYVIVHNRVLGADWQRPVWGAAQTQYALFGEELRIIGVDNDDIVLVNNPPGLYLATGRPAISIPDGGVESLLTAAARYGAKYVILEGNHPADLDSLYLQPTDQPGLRYLKTSAGAHFFEVYGDG